MELADIIKMSRVVISELRLTRFIHTISIQYNHEGDRKILYGSYAFVS